MEWTDTALVLHVGRFREADLWVRLLAPGQGLVTAFAFGGSKSRRRFTGCLDVFNLIRTRASFSRNGLFLNLQEATLLEGPERLRADWRRQGIAANCIRFVEALGVPPDGAAAGFALTRDVLGLLENAVVAPALTPLFFSLPVGVGSGLCPGSDHLFPLRPPAGRARRRVFSGGRGRGPLPRLPSPRRHGPGRPARGP